MFRRILVAAGVATVAACGAPQGPAGPRGPTEVGVLTLAERSVSIVDELPGRTVAYRVAEVRPQVSGIVQKRMFEEGSEVKNGEQLYQIDAATYSAALRSAEAALQRSDANRDKAALLKDRYAPLHTADLVSKQAYDDSVTGLAAAEADVAAAKAQVETARINVVYCQVRSPISGRVGRSLVTEGALVTSQQTAALAVVQQLDPIYVDITQSSVDMVKLQRAFANGELQRDQQNDAEVSLTLEDGSDYKERGKLQFAEVTVDRGTGAVLLRALFPNPTRELLPGMFVRAKLTQATKRDALLVPQRGVTRNQQGDAVVLVVGEGNVVAERVVTAARTIGNDWLISGGLKAGDRVVLDGLQKVRAGAQVKPVEVAAEQSQPGGAPAAGVAQR
ncbi:MAG: efflux RND transporter periplasmic adaptor subunit [Gammaproteobacteria bacterium]